MPVYVTFWGTRGSIPTPGHMTQRFGGNTSCVELRTADTTVICDAGTGLRALGQALIREGRKGPFYMFFSHPHWDHIQGFPFFVPAYDPQNEITVFGGEDEEHVHALLSGQMQPRYFPVQFEKLGARILEGDFVDDQVQVGSVKVRRFKQHHPGGSFGYVFDCEGARVIYSTDNELDQLLVDPKADLERLRVLPEEVVNRYRGADLLIADAQYADADYVQKKGWGHPRATTVVDLAIQAGVKQLALFHHDPLQTDPLVEEKVRVCQERARRLGGGELKVFAAREEVTLKL